MEALEYTIATANRHRPWNKGKLERCQASRVTSSKARCCCSADVCGVDQCISPGLPHAPLCKSG
jgi:hypothetical protein